MFLNDLFRRIAEQNPHTPFLFEDERIVTYGEFKERVGYLVQELRKKGVGPLDRVGIYLQNSIEGITSIYAVVACGATFVPLSIDDPNHRLALTVQDADLKLVLAGPTHRFPIPNSEVFEVNFKEGRYPSIETENLSDEQPLYMIYTSGSTGVPKGALMSGTCLGHFCRWVNSYLNVQANDVFLGHARLTFDISLFHVFAPVLKGASIQLVTKPAEVAYPGNAIGDKVSIAMFVPRVTGLMQQAGQLEPGKYSRLRHVIFCGERLHAYQANSWIKTLPHVQIHNMYGPTETTVVVMYHSLSKGHPVEDPIPIGLPIPGNAAEFLDERGNLIEGEASGELILAGPQTSPWDYWRQSTDRYFEHPRLGRCFRSGDIVRRNTEGLLYWEGRSDDQIKVRGFRIELTDIEASLADSALSDLACVYDPESERVLCAYCSTQPASDLESKLRKRAGERLPAYMRPHAYFSFNELPRTVNGKTDRRVLLRRILSLASHEYGPQQS